MKKFSVVPFLVIAVGALVLVVNGLAQNIPAANLAAPPDFSGIWVGNLADITTALLPGEEIVLTPYGAEMYKKVDMAKAPSYECLPYGPTRGLQSTNAYMIIPTPNLFTIIMESIDYRLIYTDGRGHPEDMLDYPEWMGHSIGRWEGDTLVVDTIGMREETWLDTAGFGHSAQLRLTERFRKTGPDAFTLTVAVNDPVFYAKPFTYQRTVRRMPKDTRLMPGRCADAGLNSLPDALPGIAGPEHKTPPKFPQ